MLLRGWSGLRIDLVEGIALEHLGLAAVVPRDRGFQRRIEIFRLEEKAVPSVSLDGDFRAIWTRFVQAYIAD